MLNIFFCQICRYSISTDNFFKEDIEISQINWNFYLIDGLRYVNITFELPVDDLDTKDNTIVSLFHVKPNEKLSVRATDKISITSKKI